MIDEARQLMQMGSDVLVAPPPFPGFEDMQEALAAYSPQIKVTPYSIPLFLDQWRCHRVNMVKDFFIRRDLITKWRPNLVHVFIPWANQGLSRLFRTATRGVPAVVSVHNCFPKREFAPHVRRRLPKVFQTIRGVYGVSPSALRMFQENFSEYLPTSVRSEVIWNFVDTDRFQPDMIARKKIREQLNCNEDSILIGTLGRIAEQKCPRRLVEAFAKIASIEPRSRFVFLGDGDMRSIVSNLSAQYGIGDRLGITGWIDPARYLPALDIHVLASEREGFGIASVEALACGVPVVATMSAGSREVLENCPSALLVEHDSSAIADGIIRLIAREDRLTVMQANARKFVASRFDIGVWRRNISEFYRAVS